MKVLTVILAAVAIIIGVSLVFAFPTMWLWNWLMPSIFGLVKINIWKALGINMFCGILFKNHSSSKE